MEPAAVGAPTPRVVPPSGWYPDPGGGAQWRRWEGTSWAEATMPYGPTPPDERSLLRERVAWAYLRPLAPFAIAAPAVAAALLAAQSAQFGPVRSWVRANFEALLHSRATTPYPTVPASSTYDTLNFIVYVTALVGLVAFFRFTSASIRVATEARYPQRHRAISANLALLVPLLGPLVAWSASCASLPTGHEARRVLGLGWGLVAAGELAFLGVYAALVSTPSLAVTWAVAALCGVTWLAAAYELPLGLGAIAEDHETFGVRPSILPS